ncbi:DUF5050 domain-containing protein [Clostridium felsineum]|uniref:DUF5050 domain-containing protein n=1 Tax=Clostridium felsineum TaxID=36839 RepID=UPI00098BEE6F|nr:DUF5050 domain-containing protein [Clostridium felsineum]URZ14882.1 hypothetical protein CLFE_008950 [Clostridium felsineum DSM 794]
MKKITMIFTLIMLFLCSGCAKSTISKASNKITPKLNYNKIHYSQYQNDCYKNGNSIGNISNYGTSLADKNYIYYSATYGAPGIYRMNYDGSNKKKLTSDKAYYLNSDDSFIYYRNVSDDGKLYKINKGDLKTYKISDDKVFYLNLSSGYLYYQNENDENKLYKMTIDGLNKQKLNNSYSSYITVLDDYIYYQDETKGNSLYKIRKDGSDETKLNNDISIYINTHKDLIYYTNDSDSGSLYKIKKDGEGKEQVDASPSHFLNLSDNYIYSSDNKRNSFFKINADTLRKTTFNLNNVSKVSNINITPNFIFFDGTENGVTSNYIMKADGSELHKLQ